MKTSMLICLATAISVQAQNFTDFPCHADSRRVVVIGGGAAAVAVAETAQANGWQAIIVDPRNHVAGMMAASNHSWLLNGSTGESVPRPEGSVKKELFARVMDSGAYPLLLSHCAGLLVMDNHITGVAIASK
ncbi:MAG: FAD-dependent oxidoreductase, partial [Victivallales bacterium]|nr:FAD-dependent oxidoreductase [Victivallales bacterium]